MNGRRQHKGGKPRAWYVADALRWIDESVHPLSTAALIGRLGLDEAQTATLRRGLRMAAKEGRVMRLARGDDGSFNWARGNGGEPIENTTTLGAAYAAALYVRAKLGEAFVVDVEATRRVLEKTLRKTSE